MPRSRVKAEGTVSKSYCSMSMYQDYADGEVNHFRKGLSGRQKEQTEKSKPRKRYRPNAAQKERERQRVFREAFANLRGHLPLEPSKKIPKRDILRLAAQYITYLTNLLNQPTAVCYLIDASM